MRVKCTLHENRELAPEDENSDFDSNYCFSNVICKPVFDDVCKWFKGAFSKLDDVVKAINTASNEDVLRAIKDHCNAAAVAKGLQAVNHQFVKKEDFLPNKNFAVQSLLFGTKKQNQIINVTRPFQTFRIKAKSQTLYQRLFQGSVHFVSRKTADKILKK